MGDLEQMVQQEKEELLKKK